MLSLKKILLPVDSRGPCPQVLADAQILARDFGAKLTTLHVADTIAPDSEDRHMVPEGLALERVVVRGDPASRIIAYANDSRPDLVMMPAHGTGRFRRLLLGSVTAKVLGGVHAPVWTVLPDPQPPDGPHRYRRVACALDLRTESPRVLATAASLAREFHAELCLIHAVPCREAAADPVGLPLLETEIARHELTVLRQEADIGAEIVVRVGPVERIVRQAIWGCGADLLIIGRGVSVPGTIGRTAYALVRDMPCPVLTCARPEAAAYSVWTEWQQIA